jgi:hypothetical protein
VVVHPQPVAEAAEEVVVHLRPAVAVVVARTSAADSAPVVVVVAASGRAP